MSPAARCVNILIRVYQMTLSSVMGRQCRFYPSCSHYTAEAVTRFGAGRGLLLGFYRIFRCHPWNPGGVDQVPMAFPKFFSEKTAACDKKPRPSIDNNNNGQSR